MQLSIFYYFLIEQSVLDNDMFIYINHIKNLQDFKAQFKDLLNMEIPEWFIS